MLPTDIVVADEFKADSPAQGRPGRRDPGRQDRPGHRPESSARLRAKIVDAKTVVWNGPAGVFEFEAFSGGTRARSRRRSSTRARTAASPVVGGGDSAAAVRTLGFDEAGFGHISTGGGASLELLEGKTLPGIAVLED